MNKQISLSVLFAFVFVIFINAQMVTNYKYSDLKNATGITRILLNDSVIHNLAANAKQTLLFCITDFESDSLREGWKYIKGDATVQENKVVFDITDEVRNKMRNDTCKTVKIKRKNNSYDIKIVWANIKDPAKTTGTKKTYTSRELILQTLERNKSILKQPYDNKKSQVDLYFNESGRMLSALPVNVDQSVVFYLHVLSKKEDKERYWINTTEGLYAPVDLSIRPFEKISGIWAQGSQQEESQTTQVEYEFITLSAGPFTSDNFSFQIAYDSINGRTCHGPVYSIKINKLYHVGLGVSVINTWLENPDFRIAPLGNGLNTIESYNTGQRTFFTFNVMWYWSVLQQKARGNIITNGRDILKDEPTWSLNRVFPTIGVSLDSKLSENLFVGVVYEFARGGSIIAGMHYGRVKELSDKGFLLNKTIYSGTTEDIRINNVYKPAFFIGVNVDTRIFNALFNRGQ